MLHGEKIYKKTKLNLVKLLFSFHHHHHYAIGIFSVLCDLCHCWSNLLPFFFNINHDQSIQILTSWSPSFWLEFSVEHLILELLSVLIFSKEFDLVLFFLIILISLQCCFSNPLRTFSFVFLASAFIHEHFD